MQMNFQQTAKSFWNIWTAKNPEKSSNAVAQTMSDALSAHRRFQKVASDAVDKLRALPDRVGLSHVLVGGERQEFSLARGAWVRGVSGIRLMLIDEKKQCTGCESCPIQEASCGCTCTRVLCEADEPCRMPLHSHEYSELVTVIKGELTEHRYKADQTVLRRASDKIFYPAGEDHEPEVHGLFMLCWSPPLKEIKPGDDETRFVNFSCP
jgi:hypothetical protein